MRILHWTDSFLPNLGGLETLVRDLTRAQREAGHEPVVVTVRHPGRSTEETCDGVSVWRRPFDDGLMATAPRELGAAVRWCGELKRRLRPDVIHLHLTQLASFYELLSRPAWPCPVVVTPHSPPETLPLPVILKRRIFREADAVTAISAHLKTVIETWTGSNAVRVVLNGVRVTPVPPAVAGGEPGRLFTAGRLVPAKGFDVALRALAQLPEARLTLAGDGVERAELERLARELGVAGRTTFLGAIHPDAVLGEMARARVVLMPSRWREPFGLVAVQAGLAARPLVASRAGALPEIVVEGETGRLVPVDDPEAMAAAVGALLADPARGARLGAAGRRRAETVFAIERCAANFDAVYRAARVRWSQR